MRAEVLWVMCSDTDSVVGQRRNPKGLSCGQRLPQFEDPWGFGVAVDSLWVSEETSRVCGADVRRKGPEGLDGGFSGLSFCEAAGWQGQDPLGTEGAEGAEGAKERAERRT